MVDYLVVGLGLAGISFCEVLENNNKTFLVINDASQTSSSVAGGLYNPVILKRFTLAWRAHEQLEIALPFYADLEKKLNVRLDYKIPVLRLFASIEEQNRWFEAADKPGLKDFLSLKVVSNNNPGINAPFGFGEVLRTGRINTKKLLSAYTEFLSEKKALLGNPFNFDVLQVHVDHVRYNTVRAKHIVFATGFGLRKNPYFNYLPLEGTKGELLTIKAPVLKERNIIKSSVFIIPLGEDLYRIGATYHWKDKTNDITDTGKSELLDKLNEFLKCDYEVVGQDAGIRPTVADRRPLLGRHPFHQNVYVLNGLGSRGVMIAPYAAHKLYDFIEKKVPLDPDVDIARFTKKFFQA